MLRTLLERELLACPTCRSAGEGGVRDHALYVVQAMVEHGETVQQGLLACPNCRTRYPVIDGVAIVLQDVAGWVRSQQNAVFGRSDLDPTLEGWLLAAWDDSEDRNWRRQMVSIYARDHAELPATSGDGLQAELRDRAAATREFHADRQQKLVADLGGSPLIADLGCAVGRSSVQLARAGAQVIAVDHDFGVLRLLARLLREGGATVPHWRHAGNDYVPAEIDIGDEVLAIAPIAADALDPPFRAGTLDGVCAYNLLDNVKDPIVLIRQIWGALRSGGRLVTSSPYDWVSAATPRWNRLGESIRTRVDRAPDPATAYRELLTGQLPGLAPGVAFDIHHEQLDLPWVLERHERSFHVFLTHYVEANKP